MRIYNISKNIKIFENNYNLSMNFISSSLSILKSWNKRIWKSVCICLGKIASFLHLIGIFEYLYNYNRYGLDLEGKILQEKSILKIQRTLSENARIGNEHDMEIYYANKRSSVISNASKFTLNINGKSTNAFDYCNQITDEMLSKLSEVMKDYRNDPQKSLKITNNTWTECWKQKIDEHMKNVQEDWIGYFNKTDTSNITAFCSPNQDASVRNPTDALTIILSVVFVILVVIVLFLIFKRTSIGSRIGCRRLKKNMQQYIEEM